MKKNPEKLPRNKNFSAGPTAKPEQWSIKNIDTSLMGRSHRSAMAIDFINKITAKTKRILNIPDDYILGTMTGSATCAIESLIWNLLGKKDVDTFSHDVFSRRWESEVKTLLTKEGIKVNSYHPKNQREIPDLSLSDKNHDGLFNFNGSTTGASFENIKIPAKDDDAIWICDATSAVFAMDIPWNDLDAVAFSFQKALGAEPAHGMIVLSPKAIKRINSFKPNWVIPTILNLRTNDYREINHGVFNGKPVNTPSLLCLAEYDMSLDIYEKNGGLRSAMDRCEKNKKAALSWIEKNKDDFFTLSKREYQSSSVICFTTKTIANMEPNAGWTKVREATKKLIDMNIVFDINNHINEKTPSFRVWLGPNIENDDITTTMDWIKWAIKY